MDLDKYRGWLTRRGRGRSATQYCRVVRRYLEDPEALEEAMINQDYAPNYRRHLVACVRSWARFAGDGELLIKLDEIRLPAAIPATPREPFSWDEWWDIREFIDESDLPEATRLVCSIIALRGIRCGDVLRLRRSEITTALDTGVLAFEGKGERRVEYNAAPLEEYLSELAALPWERHYRRVHQLVGPTEATASRTVRRAFDAVARELGMSLADLHAHRFRHTYAHFFLQQMEGDPEAIFKLQQQMGWAKLETAASYMRRSRREELNEIESKMLSDRKSKGRG